RRLHLCRRPGGGDQPQPEQHRRREDRQQGTLVVLSLLSLRERAEPRIKQAWRRALVLRARDWTEVTERRSCLVLAAHPDDETFACGATILRKTDAGTPVRVFIATDGRNANPSSAVLTAEELGAVRRAEAVEVGELLGVKG